MDEKPYGVIYCITNKVNGKIYIGQTTKTIEKRLKGHFYESKCSDYYIHRAINKYGINNFYIKQIDFSFTKEYLNELEKYYIDFFCSSFPKIGYNGTLGGEGGTPNEETCRKLSETHKGNKHPMFGRTGKNNPLYGRHPSEEIRKKLSESHKGEKNHNFGKFGKEHPGSIKVICVETGEVFDSIREIERKYKYFHGDISKCCKGKQNTCGKLHWQYFKK